MISSSRIAACVAASLLVLAGSAHAHSPWLKASNTVLSKPQWVSFDAAASNGLFDIDHQPLNPDGLTVVAPDGKPLQAENLLRQKLRLVFDLQLTQPGTYRVAILNQGLTASYKDAAGQARRWRGTAETLATGVPADARELAVTEIAGRVETLVTVGKPSAIQATGRGLELIPVTAPTDLAKGEKATFTLLLDGQPAAGLEITATRGETRYRDKVGEIAARTDAAGRVSFTWPEAGMYYLEASVNDARTSVAQARQRRASYAGTLEVLP